METVGPDKKVSEIFLRYVAPLFDGAPKDLTPEYIQHAYKFPLTIWNAVVMKHWGKPTDYIREIIDQIARDAPKDMKKTGEAMVHMWVHRKEALYPDEHWAIEDVIVYRDFSGELIARVIARAPEKYQHQRPTVQQTADYRSTLN